MKTKRHELLEMLTYRRPAGGKGEAAFIAKYIDTLPGATKDRAGNRIVVVGPDPKPRVMFSAHTDSVHGNDGMQRITYDPQTTFIDLSHAEIKAHKASFAGTVNGKFVREHKGSNCLGADDATGIYLMRRMIKAGVPGIYVFHREEEIGGHGSRDLASRNLAVLENVEMCIAFDRKGYDDVITHQANGRCCSDEFATALAGALNAAGGFSFQPDPTGSFTDSANYDHVVAECTNLSVGYFHQHTTGEYQNLSFAERLADALCLVKWHELPVARQPGDSDMDGGWDWGNHWNPNSLGQSPESIRWGELADYDESDPLDYNDLSDFVFENPGAATDLLYSLELTAGKLFNLLGTQPRSRAA